MNIKSVRKLEFTDQELERLAQVLRDVATAGGSISHEDMLLLDKLRDTLSARARFRAIDGLPRDQLVIPLSTKGGEPVAKLVTTRRPEGWPEGAIGATVHVNGKLVQEIKFDE